MCLIVVTSSDLQRGKFRPRLQQLVASNSDDMVEKCSRKAFSLLPDVRAAIAELSALKGVGPATASGELEAKQIQTGRWSGEHVADLLLHSCDTLLSASVFVLSRPKSAEPQLTLSVVPAVLAAGEPGQAAFMSDEAMESVPGLKPIQYTAKHYDLYLGKLVEKTEKLNKGEIALTDCSELKPEVCCNS